MRRPIVGLNSNYNYNYTFGSSEAIYACRFAQCVEVTAGSVTKPMRLNINMAHCLLGHRNEDSVCKTARELDWTTLKQSKV
jgi:hypothetical protein